MKTILAIALGAVLFGIAFNASATGKPDPVPPSSPTEIQQEQGQTQGQMQGQEQGQGQLQAQQAQAEAGAAARSNSNATGGDANSESYNALSNDINYNSRMRSITLANPVWTLIPQAGGKCTVSESSAESVVFGVWSGSRSKQFTDAECAMMQMSNSYRQACQFKTAAMIDKTLFERFNDGMDGEFLLADAVNLTPVQCADLLRPRLIMDTRVSTPPAAPAAPVNIDVNASCVSPGTVTPRPPVRSQKRKPAPKKELCPKADRAVHRVL